MYNLVNKHLIHTFFSLNQCLITYTKMNINNFLLLPSNTDITRAVDKSEDTFTFFIHISTKKKIFSLKSFYFKNALNFMFRFIERIRDILWKY